MHVPDHLIDPGIELIAGISAAAVFATAALATRRRAPGDDGPTLLRAPERLAPQAATASLVFALQMVNVPVLPGTSGHLLGGALATALLGPRRALFAMGSVVAAQALLFADGGTAALGINLWLIAILPVAVAALARTALAPRAAHGGRWWSAVALGAVAAPVVASAAFAGLFALGGTGAAPGRVVTAMVGTHAAIALAEVGISLAVIALVGTVATRWSAVDTAPLWGMAAVSATGLSLLASSAPDGLERVLGDLGVAVDGPGSLLHSSPLAEYTLVGLGGPVPAAVAGTFGVLAAATICRCLAALTRTDDAGSACSG